MVTVRFAVTPLSEVAVLDRLNDFVASSIVSVAPEKVSVCAPTGRVIGSAGAPTATVRVRLGRIGGRGCGCGWSSDRRRLRGGDGVGRF
jgi:hypothetical protein